MNVMRARSMGSKDSTGSSLNSSFGGDFREVRSMGSVGSVPSRRHPLHNERKNRMQGPGEVMRKERRPSISGIGNIPQSKPRHSVLSRNSEESHYDEYGRLCVRTDDAGSGSNDVRRTHSEGLMGPQSSMTQRQSGSMSGSATFADRCRRASLVGGIGMKPLLGTGSGAPNRRTSLVVGNLHRPKAEPRRGSVQSIGSWLPELEKKAEADDSVTQAKAGAIKSKSRKEYHEDCLIIMDRLVRSPTFSIVMAVFSLFALYGDDIRLAAFKKEDDIVFNVITMVTLLLFTLEITCSCLVIRDYMLSFFFWLDVISTVSLILDLTFVWEALMDDQNGSVDGSTATGEEGNALGQSEYARAGRSSRVGTRMARIMRVVRLVRLTRVFKFCLFREKNYDFTNQDGRLRDLPARLQSRVGPGQAASSQDPNSAVLQQSVVGQKLSERTTLWVVVLVLAMLIAIPLLDVSNPEHMMISSAQYGADVTAMAWHNFVNAGQASQVVLAERRLSFEQQLLTYVYYHDHPFARCKDNMADDVQCSAEMLYKLCFLGFVSKRSSTGNLSSLLVGDFRFSSPAWDTIFGGSGSTERADMLYSMGDLPQTMEQRFTQPWSTACSMDDTKIHGVSFMDADCPWKDFRRQDLVWYMGWTGCERSRCGRLVFVFDIRESVAWEARMSTFRTTFLIIVLAVAALVFSKDADRLVLQPIEDIVGKIDMLRKDPLYVTTMADEIALRNFEVWSVRGLLSSAMKRANFMVAKTRFSRISLYGGKHGRGSDSMETMPNEKAEAERIKKKKKTGMMETTILENTVVKLGSLLALGFGEAGTDIIGENLDDSNAAVNVMIPGRIIQAIYGYCHINNFMVTTDVLQEKTVVFVNKVAHIVHSTVDQHLGSANKNLGEAFLLVWRLDQYEASMQSKIADISVLSFIKVVAAINTDPDIASFRNHPLLVSRSASNPSHLTHFLTFGLHLGSSIAGAIGSEFKIDASYLSTHVNLAMHLEALSLFYGVIILISEPLVRACSVDGIRRHFRAIDKVKSDLDEPVRVFTVDLDCRALMDGGKAKRKTAEGPNQSFQRLAYARILRRKQKLEKLENRYVPLDVFNNDRHIQSMRTIYTWHFYQRFERGYLNYEAGEWGVAAEVLQETCFMLKTLKRPGKAAIAQLDGPSRALLHYMMSFDYKAPPGWSGFRKYSEVTRMPLADQCFNRANLSGLEMRECLIRDTTDRPNAALPHSSRVGLSDERDRILAPPPETLSRTLSQQQTCI